jgi:hypothetical protein
VREVADRANSRQAKGRVERQHGTHQDRLVKKLRRKEIGSQEGANVYLQREYLPEHNQHFARAAARPEDYHRRAPRAAELGWYGTTIAFSNWNRRDHSLEKPD